MSSETDHRKIDSESRLILAILLFCGVCFFYMAKLAMRFPKTTIAIIALCFIGDYVDAHYFSPMTRDLGSEVSSAYKNVRVIRLAAERDKGYFDDNELPYFQHHEISKMLVIVKNSNPGRITSLTFHCTGQTVLQPPDASYAPEVKDDEADSTVLTTIPANSVKVVEVFHWNQNSHRLRSGENNVKCSITDAEIDEGDLYRGRGEVDRYGAALVKNDLTVKIADKPVVYGGDAYALIFKGSLVNVSTKSVSKIKVGCSFSDGVFDSNYAAKEIAVDLKPGATLDLQDSVAPDFLRNSAKPGECHVVQAW